MVFTGLWYLLSINSMKLKSCLKASIDFRTSQPCAITFVKIIEIPKKTKILGLHNFVQVCLWKFLGEVGVTNGHGLSKSFVYRWTTCGMNFFFYRNTLRIKVIGEKLKLKKVNQLLWWVSPLWWVLSLSSPWGGQK
jgi:hypothetical protein